MMAYRGHGFVLLTSVLLVAPVAAQTARPAPPDATVTYRMSAIAWPEPLTRRRMASGQPYRPDDWVVAHATLPIGTRLLLSDERGRRSAVVTVADRASLLESGSMLVSRAASELLGIPEDEPRGVRYRRMARGENTTPGPWTEEGAPATHRTDRARWSVQLGSFSDRSTAERYAELLDGARVERVRVGRRSVYRVYFGRFTDRDDAEAWRERLAGWGITGFVKSLEDS